MNHLWLDVRFALRQLRKSPGFALTAVLTLAFGIGAAIAIFSIVEGVLLRPLPFADPDRLVVIGDVLEGSDLAASPSAPASEVVTYTHDTHGFSSIGAYQQTGYEISGADEPAQINASRLGAGVFQTLGVSPIMGRVFTQQEDVGHEQVAVISYQTWRSRFHGNPNVLGTKILLDRKPYEVIGIMPRDFEFPLVPGRLNRSELWVPLSFTQGELVNGVGNWSFAMVGRLKPGISPSQAQQDAEVVARRIQSSFPAAMKGVRIHALVQKLDENTVSQARPLVRTLFFAVTVVLFIACANLAGLLLVRVIRHRREISMRLALGASGAAVIRQSLIETLTLSIIGGILGLVIAAVALRLGISFLPETLPRIGSIALDWHVIGFALLLVILTGFFCGLIPASAAARTSVNESLKEGGRTGSSGGAHARLRSVLVVGELAVALVLLCGAGLLLRSFEKLREVGLGFRTDHSLTASYSLPHEQYSTQAAVDAFNSALLTKLQQLPGVQAVGITGSLPGVGINSRTGFVAEGYLSPKGAQLTLGWPDQISGDYFAAAGIPLLRGRAFTPADRADSPLVVIVNHTLAEHYWPGQDPIGKRIHIGVADTPLPWMTVVGEIGDLKQGTAEDPTEAQFYQPIAQLKETLGQFATPEMLNGTSNSILVRGQMPPEQMADSVRAVVRSIDPQLPLTQVESFDRIVSESEAPRRFNTALISTFAMAAVLLALLGIYSVIAFSAAMRTQEMAIRMALGSQRSSVLQLVLASAAKLGLIGCGLGTIAAVFATRLMRSLLFQVDPLDPGVMILAAICIFVLALAASIIPAARAASIDPMQALRTE